MRKGEFIQTFSGLKFWPADPAPEEVKIEDIAHALSNLCRFTGHVREFISVAQHSVAVSEIVPPEYALLGLLHDAAEAYIGDISRPMKKLLRDRGVRDLDTIEANLLACILGKFDVPGRISADGWDKVHQADAAMLMTEARDLMSPLVDGWGYAGVETLAMVEPLTPSDAKEAFLWRFEVLMEDVRNGRSNNADVSVLQAGRAGAG